MFETKLNAMHAVHRELEAKFKKAEKLYEKTFERNKYLEGILQQSDQNYNNLKLNQLSTDSKSYFDKEKISMLTFELCTKTQH
jgi:O-acetylhomoserine/O-acetylserine sulfhydrylase-like pyridoxal-dependent enzyme